MVTGQRSGAMASVEVLTGNIEFFTLFTTLDITASGNFADNSQKDFESVVQVIGMRAMPTVMNNPVQLNGSGNNKLENYGAPTLTGAGFIFKFEDLICFFTWLIIWLFLFFIYFIIFI